MSKRQELLFKAKNDFEKAIKGKTKHELKEYLPGFGIKAMRFAIKYIHPDENKELYDKIYNIYFNFFYKLDKELKQLNYKNK